MTLLDRFRGQARHKHADPAVRLAYVGEIPLDERDVIGAIAREDEDPRVRRAAVAKLMDTAALGAIARDDGDETVRDVAAGMLRDIALEAFEGIGEAESLDAVDALGDVRQLAQIAKTSGREIVALRALSRLSDARTLGSVARHAASEAVRRGAFERLRERDDHAEIVAVAMNSEFKDAAVAAVEHITLRAELEQIAARSRNKGAVKRARGLLREADEWAAREAAAAGQTARDTAAAEQTARATAAAAQTAPDAGLMEAAAPETAVAPADRAVTESQSEAGAPADGADGADGAARARDREDEAARAQAAASAAREQAAHEAERRHARLAELAGAAADASSDADLSAARRRFAEVRREWTALGAGEDVDQDLVGRFEEAAAALSARDLAAHDVEERQRRDALARLRHLIGRVEPLAGKADLTLKAADRALRDLRTALADVPPLPSRSDFEDVSQRLKAAQAALTPKAQELRETDEWQRWANAGIQEQLIARMEALRALEDPEAVAREVRELQQQWRAAADAPRVQADALWRRFKAAHDAVWAQCEAHFAAQAEVRAENLARKTALCEEVEALAESTQWIQTSETIKRLQGEWKAIGPVSRGREKAIWDRFRSACDRFFTRRHDDLVRRKATWAENLAKKDALCARAEALAESSDWEPAAAEMRRLQGEWKAIGPVKQTQSERIWQRFRAASDHFFTRYAQRHDTARAERVAAREAICVELESLCVAAPAAAGDGPAPDAQPAPTDVLAAVRQARNRWQQEIAAGGADPTSARVLDARFAAAMAGVLAAWPAAFAGTDLDPDANRRKLETLARRMEDLVVSLAGPAGAPGDAAVSPTTKLAAMLKEALAANTIGGRADEDSRWRAAGEEVRQAQAAWARVGPVPETLRRPLADRFQRACRRILERATKTAKR